MEHDGNEEKMCDRKASSFICLFIVVIYQKKFEYVDRNNKKFTNPKQEIYRVKGELLIT